MCGIAGCLYNDEKKFEVSISKLDEYTKKNKIKFIDILKIDTQGYELEILKGSLNLIENKKINCIILEIILSDTYNQNFSFFDIETFIFARNYIYLCIFITIFYCIIN